MRVIKFFVVVFLIALHCILSLIAGLIIWNRWSLAKYRAHQLSLLCRWGLQVMGVNIYLNPSAHTPDSHVTNALVVSNHLSYLDVLIIASLRPTCFVTSTEIKETPILGHIARIAGCLFVDRRTRENLPKEIEEITLALKNDINVTIFPEATSTNGNGVLRFKKPLYTASHLANRPVLPLCLNYLYINGTPVNSHNRDHIFWYGDMSFAPHLWSLMELKEVVVSVSVLQKLSPTDDVTQLSTVSHQKISEVFLSC